MFRQKECKKVSKTERSGFPDSFLKRGAKVCFSFVGKKCTSIQKLLIKDEKLTIIWFGQKKHPKNKILFLKIVLTFVHLVYHFSARQTGILTSTLCMNGKDQLRAQVSNPDGCRVFLFPLSGEKQGSFLIFPVKTSLSFPQRSFDFFHKKTRIFAKTGAKIHFLNAGPF